MKINLLSLYLILFTLLSSLIVPAYADAAYISPTLILPYENLSGQPELDWIGEGVRNYLQQHLGLIEGAQFIRPEYLKPFLQSGQIPTLNISNPEAVRKIGNLVQAQFVIYGAYNKTQTLEFTTYLLDVRTGGGKSIPVVTGNQDELLSVIHEILKGAASVLGLELVEDESRMPLPTQNLGAFAAYTKAYEALLFFDDADKALENCQQAIKLDNQYEEALSLLIKLYEMKSSWKQLPALYKRYEEFLEARKDRHRLREVYDKIIPIYTNIDRPDLALRYCNKELKLSQAQRDRKLEASCYVKIGAIYQEKKNYNSAIIYHLKALAIQNKLGNNSAMGAINCTLGNLYFIRGLDVSALKHLKKATSHFRQVNDRNGIGKVYSRMGKVYAHKKQYDKALKYSREAAGILEQSKNQEELIELYDNMGDIYFNQANYNEALGYFQKILELLPDTESSPRALSVYNKIATLQLRQSRDKEAIDTYRKIIKLQEKTNSANDSVIAYYHLGSIFLRGKKYEEAIDYLKQAEEGFQRIKDRERLSDVYHSLAEAYEKNKKYLQALKYQLKNLEVVRTTSDSYSLAATYYYISAIYDRLGQYEKAINYVEKAVELDRKLASPNERRDLDYMRQLKEKLKRPAPSVLPTKLEDNPPTAKPDRL